MDLEDFTHIYQMDDAGILAYFQDHGLLRRHVFCTACNRDYTLVRQQKSLMSPYVLRCPRCKTTKRLTAETMYERARMPLKKLFGLLYMWSYCVTIQTATSMLAVSSATVVQWYQHFR